MKSKLARLLPFTFGTMLFGNLAHSIQNPVSAKQGALKVTYYNTYNNPHSDNKEYDFILYRESEPDHVIRRFKGKLAYGDTKTYLVKNLEPGNYLLVGLRIPDPQPGNIRLHQIMIYSKQTTVYDVTYLKNSKLRFS